MTDAHSQASIAMLRATIDALAAPLATIEHLLAQRSFLENDAAQASYRAALEDAYEQARRLASELAAIRQQIPGEAREERSQAREGPRL